VKIVPTEAHETTREEHEWEAPALGSWWWHKSEEYGEVLCCATEVGSNYVELKSVHGWYRRVHFDALDEQARPERDPSAYLRAQIERCRGNVHELLQEIQRITAQLGIVPREALDAAGDSGQALAVMNGAPDVGAHKAALIKTKEKTLPDLFKQVEKQHEEMALWMKAELMPTQAQLGLMRGAIEQINDRIFTVELYAGLVESIEKIADGAPASDNDKIHLFQRRHYMDEECLVNYEAGGMKFRDIAEFDTWLLRPENRTRILPKPRSVVAFRVRRTERDDDDEDRASLWAFISFMLEAELDKQTFLYIRNGEQVFRLQTEIDFGPELFPDTEHESLLNGTAAWIDLHRASDPKPITQAQYEQALDDYQAKRDKHAKTLREWRKKGKPDPQPWFYESRPHFEPLTRESVHYDDVMTKITKMTRDHNRVAVVLQGLLDRSPVFHPHPPWRLWTSEGFTRAIELVYDSSKALTVGDPPDFEAYRARLNASLGAGSITVGQEDAWLRAEGAKEEARRRRDWRSSGSYLRVTRYHPSGNPGPGLIAKVERVDRNGRCHYTWTRSLKTDRSWQHGSYPTTFACPSSSVLNVDAYRPGDFKIFYEDPRTRAAYLKWAPLLLAAEDYVQGKRKLGPDSDEE